MLSMSGVGRHLAADVGVEVGEEHGLQHPVHLDASFQELRAVDAGTGRDKVVDATPLDFRAALLDVLRPRGQVGDAGLQRLVVAPVDEDEPVERGSVERVAADVLDRPARAPRVAGSHAAEVLVPGDHGIGEGAARA
jgi:hypothetical protein